MAQRNRHRKISEPISAITTRRDLICLFENMGLQKGMLVLVQGNMRKLGYICGGAQALLDALMEVVSYEGTIVIPAFTDSLLDPSCARALPIERDSWEDVRLESLPFDRKKSCQGLQDELSLQFMRNDGVARSYHPLHSFLAWGKYAKILCEKHPLHFSLSKDSPLGRMYDMNAYALNLGIAYQESVAFHLAHYFNEMQPIHVTCAPIEKGGKTVWKDMLEIGFDQSSYGVIGEIMEDRGIVKDAYINHGHCRFYSTREAVNIANAYFHIPK